MGVAVATVDRQLAVVADVLGEEDPVAEAGREQLEEQLHDSWFAVAFHRGERHPEEVELEVRAASADLEVVVESRI